MSFHPEDSARDLLAEKDRLIAALTEQLELAVNQLDRLHRTGADRPGARTGGGGPGLLPSQILAISEEATRAQDELAEKVNAVLHEWHQIRPAEHILRIEDGIERVLELVQKLQSHPAVVAAPVVAAPPVRQAPPPAKTAPPAKPSASSHPGSSSHSTHASFWEATKARLLDEEGGDSGSHHPAETMRTPPEPDEILPPPRRPSDSGRFVREVEDEPREQIEMPPPPEPVALNADRDALLQGIESRDQYIQFLTTRLREAENRRYMPVPWDQLADIPEKLRNKIRELQEVLQDQLKQAEIANSLERAVLARERGRLIQVKQSVEDQIRHLKPQQQARGDKGGDKPSDSQHDQSDADRRWKRLFSR